MINLAISLAAGLVTLLLFGFALGGGQFNVWYGLLPAVIVIIGAYVYLMRRTLNQVEAVMTRAQGELMKIQQIAARPSANVQQRMNEQFDKAAAVMKEAYQFSRWQFLVESQINAQLGSLYYLKKDFEAAEPFLHGAFYKNWMAQAMLALILFRRRDYAKMTEVFENAVKANKDEAMLWSLYAWCLWKNKQTDEAIAVLSRGKQHNATNQNLEINLLALQNKQKFDMRIWGEIWYQFHLDKPPQEQLQQHQQQQMAAMGKISRRGTYR